MTGTFEAVPRRVGLVRGVFLRFGAVGIAATLSDIVLFNVFHSGLGINPLVSKAMAAVFAMVIAYAGSRWWAFRDAAGSHVGAEFLRFATVNLLALGISELCIVVTYYLLGLHGVVASNISANVIGQILSTAFRFWAYSVWVFSTPSVRSEAPLRVEMAGV
jgi:putative flippase GtrA